MNEPVKFDPVTGFVVPSTNDNVQSTPANFATDQAELHAKEPMKEVDCSKCEAALKDLEEKYAALMDERNVLHGELVAQDVKSTTSYEDESNKLVNEVSHLFEMGMDTQQQRTAILALKKLLKKFTITLASFLFMCSIAYGQTPALQNQAFGFDYPTADITVNQITRFDMKVDSGGYTSVNIPPTANDANTPVNFTTYKVAIPVLTVGNHSVLFRACSAAGCSVDSTSLAFKLVVLVTPTGLRIIGDDELDLLFDEE